MLSALCFKQVNGNDLTNATHQEAVNALVAPKYRLTLLVRHDPRPAGYQVSKQEADLNFWLYNNSELLM